MKARIDINGDNGMLIGGYKGGLDTDAIVLFGRTSDTGTSNGLLALPSDSFERDHISISARLLYMPQSGGVERIGAFYCEAHKGGVTERIDTIIMSASSKII